MVTVVVGDAVERDGHVRSCRAHGQRHRQQDGEDQGEEDRAHMQTPQARSR